MYLFSLKPQYDRDTGKSVAPKRFRSGVIDDYTGELIPIEYDAEKPSYNLSIFYDNSSEPIWYYIKERETLEKEYSVDYQCFASLMHMPYAFRILSDGHGMVDTSFKLIEEWMMNIKNGLGPFRECGTIEEALRTARLRTLLRLLKTNEYGVDQLGLTNIGEW